MTQIIDKMPDSVHKENLHEAQELKIKDPKVTATFDYLVDKIAKLIC